MNTMLVLIVLSTAAMTVGSPSIRVSRQSSYNSSGAAVEEFQTEPRRAVVRPGESITLLGDAGTPLRKCNFYLPSGRVLDFSEGEDSRSVGRYEYFGRGLDNGECGLRIKRAENEDNGIVECKVKPEGGGQWEKCATTLRVTNVPVSEMPVFDIEPRKATLTRGDDITIKCNADRAIKMCHIYLPGPRYLDFDRGADSISTSEYRYHGSGLRRGHCGVTLTGVDTRLTGYVVCKVGQFPDDVTGPWETDAMKVTTNDISSHNTGTTRRTSQAHGNRPTPSNGEISDEYPTRRPSQNNGNRRTTPPSSESDGEECGRVKLMPSALVTHGQGTEQGQWPWHVAMYQNKGKDLAYICGGSLISRNVVLTAAHCVTRRPSERLVNPESLVLYFGKYRRLVWSEGGVQNKQIDKIHVHSTYNGTTLSGDIAIVILKSPVDYTDYVRHVCLWEADKAGLNEVVGKEGTVVGWGYDETGESPPELMMAKMPVVDHQTCIWSYQDFFSVFTSNRTLCAGFRNGTSVCNGDSGGGLVFPTKKRDNSFRWHLRALVSLSAPKGATRVCDPHHYVVFTDVAQYLSWIEPYVQ